MARQLRSTKLDTRHARLKLPPQDGAPHFAPVARGIFLGYRAGPGSWSVRYADGKGGKVLKSLNAIADDHEEAEGDKVLTFWQASEKARKFARGQDADAGRPVTVDQALKAYADDLIIRGAGSRNASHPRHHLPPSLLAMPVSLLTVRVLRQWRNDLAKVMKASTVNRLCKALKAALNLAASHDDRITNSKAWTIGLAALPELGTESNIVLTSDQRRDLIAACYAVSPAFGLYAETHDATGARSSQIAELTVGDLETGPAPLLRMPSSLKGKNRRTRTRKPIPISASLAQRLKQAAGGRSASEPLLLMQDGGRWSSMAHRRPWAEAVKGVKLLPKGTTLYALRHSRITSLLLAGVPVRLVASSLDTSVAMLEKTYSKNISDHGDAVLRKAMLDAEARADSNVVALRR